MSRVRAIILPVMVVIIGAILTSGCTLTPAGNNTTATPLPAPVAQRPNLVSVDTVPVIGHVYLDGKPVNSAYVMAVSLDGSDSVMSVTNEKGGYQLNVRRGVWYRVNATYQSLQHTVWPVYLPGTYAPNEYDINLSRTPRSTIEGSAMNTSSYAGSGVRIDAVPQNASAQVTTVTDENGRYLLDVEPGIYYYVTGQPQTTEDRYMAQLKYRNGEYCNKIKPGSDETVLIDYDAFPLFYSRTWEQIQPPISPVTVSGHAYIEGREASGAFIEAVSFDGSDHIMTNTDESGYYQLNLESGVPYRITARFMGLQHTIWPVYMQTVGKEELQYYSGYYDSTGNYDINLTFTPYSMIAGPIGTHHILVTATPLNDSKTVSTVSGYNGTYSLNVEPGIRYSLTAEDYYGQLHFYTRFQGRNEYNLLNFYDDTAGSRYFHENSITVGDNETALIKVDAMMPI